MLKELKGLNQWVCYSVEPRKGNPEKMDKIPKNPKTGRGAESNNPETWGSYAEAVEATRKYNFAGVGFMLNGYCGIDIDGCIDEQGNIKNYAKEIIETLDSYTEISPSGTGVHIIVKGTLPEGRRRNRKLDIEMYQPKPDFTQGRYFTITENHWGEPKPVQHRQEQLEAVFNKYLADKIDVEADNDLLDSVIADKKDLEIVEAIKKSQKGKDLLEGNWKKYKQSQSEADESLFIFILSHTQDKEQAKRIFKSSGLYRKKADREDYLDRTIKSAIDYMNRTKEEKPKEETKSLKIESCLSLYDGFIATIKTKKPVYSTGFQKLDNLLDGGLYEGSYIINAGTSMGKTTLVHQIGDNLAKEGHSILYFSLEMGKHELMAKSISRETFFCGKKNYQLAMTSRQILRHEYTDSQKDVFNDARKNFLTYAENFCPLDGIGDIGTDQIRETIKNFIETRGKKPVVIIDYLQILARNEYGDKRERTDKDVLEIKRMSRDFQIPILTISSVGRQNYHTEASLEAGKESGGIEYGADVVIGLQAECIKDGNKAKENKRNLKQFKELDKRRLILTLLKNRHGKAYGEIEYIYHAPFNCFEEGQKVQSQKEIEEKIKSI